ncbi:S-adenosyl-L-methionine-dependent methyltransferase, partial [Hyaloraphidium curvatum]
MARPPLRTVEFFCGIGGLRYALEWARLPHEVVAAFDIAPHTNLCYERNFGHRPTPTAIERLSVSALDEHRADLWLDKRSAGLLNLVEALPAMKSPPTAILLENVVGFEVSECRRLLVQSLEAIGCRIMEFILTSLDFGVPNDRQRYYLAARRLTSVDWDEMPAKVPYLERGLPIYRTWPPFAPSDAQPAVPPPLSDFLSVPNEDIDSWLVPPRWILPRHGFIFDMVRPSDRKTSAFTASYATHFVVGTGPWLQTAEAEYDFKKPETLLPLRLRVLTPIEIARLHCFPVDLDSGHGSRKAGDSNLADDGAGGEKAERSSAAAMPIHGLAFPGDLSRKSQYRAIGNSLNVKVVGSLLRDVLYGEDPRLFA